MDINTAKEKGDFTVPEKNDSTLYKELEHLFNMKLMRIERQIKMLNHERKSLQEKGGQIEYEIQKQKPYLRGKELDFYRIVDKIYAYQYLKIEDELSKLNLLMVKYQQMLADLPFKDYEDLVQDIDVSSNCAEFINLTPRITLSFSFNTEELNNLLHSFREAESPDSYLRKFLEKDNHIYIFKSLFELDSYKANPCSYSAKSSSVYSLPINFPCLDKMTQNIPQDNQMHKSEKVCSESSHSSDGFEIIDKDGQSDLQCNNNDIENLSEISSVSNSNFISEWLRKNDSLDNFKQMALKNLPCVMDICKSERKCSNYSSCTCPTNCLVAHLKEQLEKLRFSDKFSSCSVNKVVNEIIQEKLDKTIDCTSQKCCRAENLWKAQAPDLKWDPNNWLSSKSQSSIDTKEWLTSTATNLSPNSTSAILKSSFSPYFIEQNNKEWLSH